MGFRETVANLALSLLSVPVVLYLLFVRLFLRECDLTLTLSKERKGHFKGKVVLVTGASSGIGEALACLLVARGAYVVLAARRAEELKRVANRCSEIVKVAKETKRSLGFSDDEEVTLQVVMDITKSESLRVGVAKAVQWKGKLDVLINNAGMGQRGTFSSFEVDKQVLDVNLMAPIELTKAVLPHFKERGSGHIVNTSSISGYLPRPGRSAYGASKAAINAYFKSLRMELEGTSGLRDIKVTTCMLGWTNSSFSTNAVSDEGLTDVAKKDEKYQKRFEEGLTCERAAQLMLQATSNQMKEPFIAKHPGLAGVFTAYLSAPTFDLIYPLLHGRYTEPLTK